MAGMQTIKIREGNALYWVCQLVGHWFRTERSGAIRCGSVEWIQECRICRARRLRRSVWPTPPAPRAKALRVAALLLLALGSATAGHAQQACGDAYLAAHNAALRAAVALPQGVERARDLRLAEGFALAEARLDAQPELAPQLCGRLKAVAHVTAALDATPARVSAEEANRLAGALRADEDAALAKHKQ